MLAILLAVMSGISALLYMRAEHAGNRKQKYIFKPLTMIFILALAFLGDSSSAFYRRMIIAGLAASLAGDIFLMLKKDRLLQGMVMFFIAHLFYITAFASQTASLLWWPLFPFLIFAALFYMRLRPFLGTYAFPALLYVLAVTGMVWMAWEYRYQTGVLLPAVGALLFMISDSVLAYVRFRKTFRGARAVKLLCYFGGQLLIAVSTGAFS